MLKHRHVIERMTLEEKCFILSGKDFWNTRGIEHVGIPQMMMSDGPHGVRKQEEGGDQLGLGGSVPATCYPTAATIANSWDPELGEELGAHLGTEAAAQGARSRAQHQTIAAVRAKFRVLQRGPLLGGQDGGRLRARHPIEGRVCLP